jgi:cytoskeletal protein CcmA (bactofilin family)
MVQSLMSNQKPSVVSEGFTLRGEIESSGVLHVEGCIIGTIKSDDVNIGNTGSIEGALTCSNLNIKGQLTGSVICDELVIAPSARVKGDLSYRFLTIGSDASIEGELICRENT